MSTTPEERPSKREAFLAFLRQGWAALYLDARRAGVVVPEAFRRQPQLILQYGLDMPVPITDLDVTDEGVTATLSFSRTPHKTHVPWSAVFLVGLTDGQELLKSETYQEDVPPGVSLNVPPPAEPEARPTPTRHLQSVPADGEVAEPVDDESSTRRRRKPQLRLVK